MKKRSIHIAVDAHGGDDGPEVIVAGAIEAAHECEHEIILVGKPGKIRKIMREIGMPERRPRVVTAEQIVGMAESPRASLRKKKSSIAIGAELIKKGEADAFISMGNTGAVMANMVMKLRTLPGISRPALAQVIPVPDHPVLLLDVGANVDCKPRHLVDFAIMGSIYAREVFGLAKPRIGVLSIGEEDGKGNELTIAVGKDLKATNLNVRGNAEGRDIFSGKFDVIVCDGFVGNVVLKFGESMGRMLMDHLKGEITRDMLGTVAALALRPHLTSFKKRVAPDEFGGAPLLGVNGVVLVGHGSSSPAAVCSAIMMAARLAERGLNEKIIAAAEENANAKVAV